MASRKSLNKRKYSAYFTSKEDKWFTGYEGDIDTTGGSRRWSTSCTESSVHTTMVLKLQPSHTIRGRSAANIVCKDEESFEYLMSMKSIDNFLQALVTGKIVIKDGFFEAEFCQVKQGQNYFIDMVED